MRARKRSKQMLTDYLRKCGSLRSRHHQPAQVIAYYADGHSLRACADRFGVSFQRVHQIIQKKAPQLMRAPYARSQELR